MKQFRLSTFDNPFDPFEQFNEWYSFDKEKGYDCCERLMRIAKLTDDMTDIEENAEIERAINEIIKFDVLNVYVKLSRELKAVD